MSHIDDLAAQWRAAGWDEAYARKFLTESIESGARLAAREREAIAAILAAKSAEDVAKSVEDLQHQIDDLRDYVRTLLEDRCVRIGERSR
jgi:hypothetical protein